jgi:hypothetical protein
MHIVFHLGSDTVQSHRQKQPFKRVLSPTSKVYNEDEDNIYLQNAGRYLAYYTKS